MSAQCSECSRERDITTEGRLARMEAKLEAIDEKLDDAVISQLRDHGKRLAALEQCAVLKPDHAKYGERLGAIEGREKFRAGWMAGAGMVGGIVGAMLLKVAASFFK